MFHEKYLRDFLKVCENGNITAAAAQLGLSQPALSRIVKTVEKEAGMPLLVREASGVYLTQAGEIYARMAQPMLENYQNGLREIHDLRDSQSGQIRLGLSRISSETLLPVILEQFRTLYPQVELRLTETLIRQLNPLLRQGKLDLALTYFPDDPELEYTRLLTDTVYLEAPPGFSWQFSWTPGTGHVLEDVGRLRNQPFILLKPGRALANHGFALIPRLAFPTLARTDQSVFFQVKDHPLDRTLYLARRKGAYMTRAMEALCGLIRTSVTESRSMVQ